MPPSAQIFLDIPPPKIKAGPHFAILERFGHENRRLLFFLPLRNPPTPFVTGILYACSGSFCNHITCAPLPLDRSDVYELATSSLRVTHCILNLLTSTLNTDVTRYSETSGFTAKTDQCHCLHGSNPNTQHQWRD